MFCIKCGNQINDGDRFCNKCGNVIEGQAQANSQQYSNVYNVTDIKKVNKTNKKSKKRLIIVLAIIVVILLIAGIIATVIQQTENSREAAFIEKIDRICEAYNNQEYDYAIEIASGMEEPYKSYYTDFVIYAEEIANWEGTGEELYQWLEDCIEYYETAGYDKTSFPEGVWYDMQLWRNVKDIKELFDEEKEDILSAYTWYEEFDNIIGSFYYEYFSLTWENRALFEGDVIDGRVRISIDRVRTLDEMMEENYEYAADSLNQMMEDYDLNEEYKQLFEYALESIEQLYTLYFEKHAVSVIFDINLNSSNDYVTVSEKDAKESYDELMEVYKNNLKIQLNMLDFDRALDSDVEGGVLADKPCSECAYYIYENVFQLYKIIREGFEYATPEVTDSQRAVYSDIYDMVYEQYWGVQ